MLLPRTNTSSLAPLGSIRRVLAHATRGGVLTALVAGAVSWAHPARALPYIDTKWYRVEFDDLTVVTDTSEKTGRRLGERLARLRHTLRMYDMLPDAIGRPVHLFVFENRSSFEPYVPVVNGSPAQLAGYCTTAIDGTFMAVDASGADDPLRIVYHEFVHAFLAEKAPRTPLWLNEGLAEFYSTFHLDGDVAVIGEPPSHHVELLSAQRQVLSDTRLVFVDHSYPEYNEGVRQNLFYAQSWGTVHYLLTDKRRRDGLKTFLRMIHQGEKPMVALEQALGEHFPDQERELLPYVLQKKLPFFRLSPRTIDESRVTATTRLTYDETLLELGDLLAHVQNARPGAAVAHFEAALRRNPDLPRAHMGLAWTYTAQDDADAAMDELRTILELDPEYGPAHTLLGHHQVWAFAEGLTIRFGDLREEPPPELATARDHFQSALRQQPNEPNALAGLGLTYMLDRDPAPGIEALTRAAAAMPWRIELVLALIQLHCHAENPLEARQLLEWDIQPRAKVDDIRSAESMVVSMEMRVADRLARSGDGEGAARVLTAAVEGTKDRSTRRAAAELLGRIEASDAARRFNEAVELAATGDAEGALAALDALIPDLPDSQIKTAAEEMRADLRRLVDRR